MSRLSTVSRLAVALVSGLAVTAVHAAAPAHTVRDSSSGSLVYISGNNVWLARPDGSAARAVTHDGTRANPYREPTQADDGTIEASLSYEMLVHLDRNGKQIGARLPVATGPTNNSPLHSMVFDSAITPNGKFVAAAVLVYQGTINPATGTQGANILAENVNVFNTATGKQVGRLHLAGTYLMAPSWVTNYTMLVFAPYNTCAPEVYVYQRTGKGWNWFADTDCTDFSRQPLNHGQLDRAHDKLAVIRGANLASKWRGSSIRIYRVSDFFKQPPQAVCSISAQHGAFGTLSWSPDGSTLAWSDSSGIWESPVDPSAPNCRLQPRLVIHGASDPYWGPAGT